MPSTPARSCVLGCPLDRVNLEQAVDVVERLINERDGIVRQSVGVNVDQLVKMSKDPSFAGLVRQADLITADGQPVVWLSRLLSHGVPQRVASIDVMEAFLPVAADKGYTIFLLGTTPELLARAREEMLADHPGLNIVGSHHGFFSEEEEGDVVDAINATKPDALFIAISSPKKERFVERNRDRLAVRFVMGVGGAFDIAAGHTTRAPGWMRPLGLEWTWRLAQEPRRMAPRVWAAARLVRGLLPDVVRRLIRGRLEAPVPATKAAEATLRGAA